MDLQLKDRPALVTGGSGGIGKAIVYALAREGARCAICGRNEDRLRAAADEIEAVTGQRVVSIVADLSDAESIKQLVRRAVDELGGLQILVNNGARASGGVPEDFWHVTDELMLRDFEEKVVGYLRCARLCVEEMRRFGWGRIVNVSGLSARLAGGISAGARNAAVVQMTKSMANALGGLGINVNAVYPGLTVTDSVVDRVRAQMEREKRTAEEILEHMASRTAIKRLVQAEEIADVVAFLCSPLSVAITGEAISVSGGAGDWVYY